MKSDFLHKSTFLLIITIFASTNVFAQKDKKEYAFDLIPKELLTNAHAVLRSQEQTFTVLSEGIGEETNKYVITILDKEGEHHGYLTAFSSSLSKTRKMKGILYDKNGKSLKKIDSQDIFQLQNYSGGGSIDGNKIKQAFLEHHEFPYTVAFETSSTTRNLLFYPTWTPQTTRDLAIEHSSFTVEMPRGKALRYKIFNAQEPTIIRKSQTNIYRWKVANLKAKKEVEKYSTNWYEEYTVVYTAPTKFKVSGYKGDLSSWENFGNWINQLNTGKHDLSQKAKDKVREIIDGVDDKKEQTKKIYQYLQENTRYVSIQLGIGGWQPFKASVVEEKKYGDCKALTNYTQAMLKEVGITSYYTLVNAGRNAEPIFKDFPMSRFNHAFLCVPLEKDTVWLECTSQTNPFNYLGNFTSNRDVLLIKPDGGEVVRTPSYKKEDNLRIQKTTVEIDENGDAKATIRIELTALQQEHAAYYAQQSADKQKKWLYKFIDIASFEIETFQFNYIKSSIPKVTIDLKVKVHNMASISNKRLFLTPNLLSKWEKIPRAIDERASDLVLKETFTDTDIVEYILPKDFYQEALPTGKTFETEFGKYETTIKLERDKLIYTRKVEINKGRYPASKYDDYISFRKKIARADKMKAVFVNKT